MKSSLTLFLAAFTPAIFHAAPPAFNAEGYRIPQPGATLEFPRAHASHPDFRIEWWYLTGHLFTAGGRRFGYQATFFRSALKPPEEQDASAFGNSQLYMTHMALTHPEDETFLFEQRLARDGWDATARTDRLEVRNGNWSLTADPLFSSLQLNASIRSEAAWDLVLIPEKPLIRFGPDGTSRKGPSEEARSYYLSFTRLRTSGTVEVGDRSFTVEGASWMDHEIASNQLDPELVGWDWIAIQLEDGWEIKAYLLRREDGTPSEYSALIWIDPEGKTTYRDIEDFQWEKSRFWTSPHSGGRYPVAPIIRALHPVDGRERVFRFEPVLKDQELDLPGSTYWEGAGDILNEAGESIGRAYLEMVGYAGPIEGLR